MALLPFTPDFQEVPVMTAAGRRLQERRKIRGVGAAERAVGNAWSRLSSWDRERIGSQTNFASLMQQRANRLEQQRQQMAANTEREKGRQSILANPGPSVLPASMPATPERSVGTPARPGGDPVRVQTPAGSASQMAVAAPQTPAPNPSRLVEHMGRQYPASIVGSPEARNKYDTDITMSHLADARRRRGIPATVSKTPDELRAEKLQREMATMQNSNPGRYNRMMGAMEADKGVSRPMPHGWVDEVDKEDAARAGRVNWT